MLGDTWEQFDERGTATSIPPRSALDVTIQAVDVSPGRALVRFRLVNELGNLAAYESIDANKSTSVVWRDLALPAGSFTAVVKFGTSSVTREFVVEPQSETRILSLAATPLAIDAATEILARRAMISPSATAATIAIPLFFTFGNAPQELWRRSRLEVTPGEEFGTLQIPIGIFRIMPFPIGVFRTINWTAVLGPNAETAVVPLL